MSKHLNIPTILLVLFLTKLLILGSVFSDSVVFLGLIGLFVFHLYQEEKKQVPVNKEFLDRIIFLEDQIRDTKGKVNAIQISNSQYRR